MYSVIFCMTEFSLGMILPSRSALITGITGQDGSTLASMLLDKGYKVFGLRPYASVDDTKNLISILDDIILIDGDVTDTSNLSRILERTKPDEIYNLAAMTHVGVSFSMPEATCNINAQGVVRLMEAMRTVGIDKSARLYQASSSEMFGNAPAPQSEETPFAPCSPYGCSKLYAYWMVRTYRQAYSMHASNGILFNHEGPHRGAEFVTRKITRALGEFLIGRKEPLALGNLEARRDWGHAHDYMRGAWMMLQQERADDYILATGQTRSVREFVNAAFSFAGYALVWEGQGTHEVARDAISGQVMVRVDEALFRPLEIDQLQGDAKKARDILGWEPQISFESMVEDMVLADAPSLLNKKRYA